MIKVFYDKGADKNISEQYLMRRDANNHYFIKEYVESLAGDFSDISSIEIETISGCNGTCSFCPVSRLYDKRKHEKMDTAVFHKIIADLSSKDYNGYISYFSNNEPLLDDRIISFIKHGKLSLPNATHSMYTNGLLLTKTMFCALTEQLDRLVIDNYNDKLEMHPHIRDLVEEFHDVDCEVSVLVRKANEILDSRAGNAPNRIHNHIYQSSCLLPFTQLVFKPTGDMTICCQDSYGRRVLGNICDHSVDEVMYGSERKRVLDILRGNGRSMLSPCKYCDIFGTVNYHMHNSYPDIMKNVCVSLFKKILKKNDRSILALTYRDIITDKIKMMLENNGLSVVYSDYSNYNNYFYLFPLYNDLFLNSVDYSCEKIGKEYLVCDILYYIYEKEE